jgi:hypothetical protein
MALDCLGSILKICGIDNEMRKIVYDNVCEVVSTRTDVIVEAEADNMRPGVSFEAYVANNKIKMKWNGKIYVGNVSGMEFTSTGPKEL